MELFWLFQSSNFVDVEYMWIPKVVAFNVVFIWKLKSLFCSSEGYLKPGQVFMMKLLAVNYFRKKTLS